MLFVKIYTARTDRRGVIHAYKRLIYESIDQSEEPQVIESDVGA